MEPRLSPIAARLGHAWVVAVVVAAVGLRSAPCGADARTDARREFRVGMSLIQSGELELGIAHLVRAYELLPHPNVLFNLGTAYAQLGETDLAIEYLERYVDTDPPDAAEVVVSLAEMRARRSSGTASVAEATDDDAPLEPDVAADVVRLREMAERIDQVAVAGESALLSAEAARIREIAARLGAGASSGDEPVPAEEADAVAEDVVAQSTEQAAAEPSEPTSAHDDASTYEETVVAASRFPQSPLRAPASTTVLSAQDLRLSGLLWTPEVLRRVAGVDVMTVTPADVNISMRGLNQRLANRVVVLVDGRSSYVDALGATLWSTIPLLTSEIERVEVLRGPASALYGANSFSGIVNIVTREPGSGRSEVSVAGGNGGSLYASSSTSQRWGPLSVRIYGGYTRTDRFSLELTDARLDYVPSGVAAPSTGYDGVYVALDSRLRVDRELTLEAHASLLDRAQNFLATGPLREFVARGPVGHAQLAATASWGWLRSFYTRFDTVAEASSAPRGASAVTGQFISDTFDVEAVGAPTFELAGAHRLHVGASYRLKTIDWTFLDRPHIQHHFAVFAQEAWAPATWVEVVLSGRVDFHPLLSSPVVSPRGAVLLHPTERSTVRASAGTAFRTPTFLESYLDLDAPTPVPAVFLHATGASAEGRSLSPESIVTAEVGYRTEDSEVFDAEINVYYNRVTQLIAFGQVVPRRLGSGEDGALIIGDVGFVNEDAVYDMVGGELMARLYPVDGLDVYANYSVWGFLDEDAGQRSTPVVHRVNVGAQYRSDIGLDFSADAHFVTDQVFSEQALDTERGVVYQRLALPAYYMINARIGYRLPGDALELFVAAYDLTDHRFRQHPYGQLLSLRVLGGATIRF